MNDYNPGAEIDALRQQGYRWSEIGRRLGTTENAARHTHRRWRAAGRAGGTQLPDHPLTAAARSASNAGGGVPVSAPVPGAERDGPRDSAGDGAFIKTEIELARQHIKRVVTAEIRLRHSILADREINETLAKRLREFDRAIQDGYIPSLALRLVADEAD